MASKIWRGQQAHYFMQLGLLCNKICFPVHIHRAHDTMPGSNLLTVIIPDEGGVSPGMGQVRRASSPFISPPRPIQKITQKSIQKYTCFCPLLTAKEQVETPFIMHHNATLLKLPSVKNKGTHPVPLGGHPTTSHVILHTGR